MTLHRLEGDVAHAWTNALRFGTSVEDAAVDLFRSMRQQGSLLPTSFALPDVQTNDEPSEDQSSYYRRRAKVIRDKIAKVGKLVQRAGKGHRPFYLIAEGQVWFLSTHAKVAQSASESFVRAHADIYLQLVLQKELREQSGIPVADTDPIGGFGVGVYLMHKVSSNAKNLQLAELRFDVVPKHGIILANVRASSFYKTGRGPDIRLGALDTGHGYSADIVDLRDVSVTRGDAREHPIRGIHLRKSEFRRTRLYYLNILTEFALSIFQRAGIAIERDTFTATHYVREGYLPLASIASLARPLLIVNTTPEPMQATSLMALNDLKSYFPKGYHVAGGRVGFTQPKVKLASRIPRSLTTKYNYLFLNGAKIETNSVRILKAGDDEAGPASTVRGYNCLETQGASTDPYTSMKFAFLMNRAVFGFCTQGLDRSPAELSGLGADTNVSATLREEVKRCLVELSLKEIVAGVKPFPVSHLVPSETVRRLTLLGTRSLNSGRNSRKTLIASIEVDIDSAGIRVRSTRRTPWSEERLANLGFVEQFPFLVDQDQEVRDRQFWMIDATSGKRLRAWHGSFVPKLLLNQRYAGIEAALAYQENERNGLRDVEFYSKSKFYNLLPYYISMRDQGTKARTESLGQLIPLQDRGRWVRIFIPPADGIDGTGTSLSGMRDVMVYTNNGEVIADGLLDEPLLHFYLHTMTNGILVSGGNSKMSLLEKFVRLTLEN